MRRCAQLARSRVLLLSLAQRSRTRAPAAAAGNRGGISKGKISLAMEADLARTSTSTETSQLLDLLARSDPRAGIFRVAVVGDVHGAWSEADVAAMGCLEADLLTFVGDFGNEAVGVVEEISKVAARIEKKGRGGGGGGKSKIPSVAVVCGNHDAWNSMTARGRERGRERAAAAAAAAAGVAAAENDKDDDNNAASEQKNNCGDPLVPPAASPGVSKQLRLLGRSHVGFSWLAFDDEDGETEGEGNKKTTLAVVGGRPFSQGGPDFKRVEQFYREMYGVEGFEDSTEKTVRALRGAAAHLSKAKEKEKGKKNGNENENENDDDKGAAVVLIAHNGPSSLGEQKHDICGADFLEDGGDWGDPDLEEALRRVRSREDEEEDEEEAEGAAAAATATTSSSFSSASVSATPCLVTFGHMHRSLRHASSAYKERNAVEVCAETGKVLAFPLFIFFQEVFFKNGRKKLTFLFFPLFFFSKTGTVFLNAAAWPRARDLSSWAVQRRVVSNDSDGGTEVERVGGGGGDSSAATAGVGAGAAAAAGPCSVHHALVVEVDRGVVTSAHDAWVTVSSNPSDGEVEEGEGSKKTTETKTKKKKKRLEATLLELKQLLRTERARGLDSRGKEVLFRSVWRGWTREFELVASRVPASAPKGWEHWRFREE